MTSIVRLCRYPVKGLSAEDLEQVTPSLACRRTTAKIVEILLDFFTEN